MWSVPECQGSTFHDVRFMFRFTGVVNLTWKLNLTGTGTQLEPEPEPLEPRTLAPWNQAASFYSGAIGRP